VLQPLQRADGRKDHEELARLVALQRIRGAHPHGLELFGLVGHGLLPVGHARHQERHVKAAGQVAVGDPVGQHEHRVGRKRQAPRAALRRKRRLAVQRGNVIGAGKAAVGVPRQQHAQFLKAFPDGGNRLRQVQLALAGPAGGVAMGVGVGGVDTAAGEDIGARREAGGGRAAGHEHFNPVGAVAQQQDGGGRAGGGGLSLGVQQLGGTDHPCIIGMAAPTQRRGAIIRPMRIRFTKMQGAGNDFVVLDETRGRLNLSRQQYRFLADRHFGVGADQILSVRPSPAPGIDFEYVIHNADGGEVEQCGNGARCFARFVHDKGLSSAGRVKVRTLSGVIEPRLNPDGRVTVDMGAPVFDPALVPFDAAGIDPQASGGWETWQLALGPSAQSAIISVAILSMGNPHAVQVVDDVDTAPVLPRAR
jgi:hypothetical protein